MNIFKTADSRRAEIFLSGYTQTGTLADCGKLKQNCHAPVKNSRTCIRK
jgi:hypothetical protein